MKYNILYVVLALLSASNSVFAMNSQDEFDAQLAATALNVPLGNIRLLQIIDPSQIKQKIYCTPLPGRITYVTVLDDGSQVLAERYIAAPNSNVLSCVRTMQNRMGCDVEIPLPASVYNILRSIHTEQMQAVKKM
jgi:hypothetical protein